MTSLLESPRPFVTGDDLLRLNLMTPTGTFAAWSPMPGTSGPNNSSMFNALRTPDFMDGSNMFSTPAFLRTPREHPLGDITNQLPSPSTDRARVSVN